MKNTILLDKAKELGSDYIRAMKEYESAYNKLQSAKSAWMDIACQLSPDTVKEIENGLLNKESAK